MMPRLAGSWPGYVFTGDPLRLPEGGLARPPAGHFGLGHGGGAHAPDVLCCKSHSKGRIVTALPQHIAVSLWLTGVCLAPLEAVPQFTEAQPGISDNPFTERQAFPLCAAA